MVPSDVCPTEDALRLFLEELVDPMLRAEAFRNGSPSLHEQQSVAKQVHLVVIQYNYYHRKTCQELDFLDFASFCKLAVDLCPVLSAYMDFTGRSDRAELTDPDTQLSLTERAIMDACDICRGLDSSKETPVIEGWPVSKVSVLLVDPRKEEFFLLFEYVALGVWGMIEKNVDEASLNPEGANKRKRIGEGPVKDDLGIEEDALRRLAFLAVKETAGIGMGDLLVLESHSVYSLSKEKSVSRFYIMQSNIPPKAKGMPFSGEDVIDRSQAPLITWKKNRWRVDIAVEYFLVRPYAGIMSDWLSRNPSKEGASVIHQDDSVALDDDLAVLASRDECLTQVARSFILRKRNNLFLQLQKIKYEIAQCSENLRILQKGGKDALALKLDCLVDASRGTHKSVPDCATESAAVDLLGSVRNLD